MKHIVGILQTVAAALLISVGTVAFTTYQTSVENEKRSKTAMRVSGQNFSAINELRVKAGLPLLTWPQEKEGE